MSICVTCWEGGDSSVLAAEAIGQVSGDQDSNPACPLEWCGQERGISCFINYSPPHTHSVDYHSFYKHYHYSVDSIDPGARLPGFES